MAACISNDIPLPRTHANFQQFKVEGRIREAAIDSINRTITVYLGESVDISADFNHVHEDMAAKIVNALKNDNVVVEYKDPTVQTAVFDRPEFESVPDFAASEDERYWNISVSMVCPLKGDGL